MELSWLNYKYDIRDETEDENEKLSKTIKNTLKNLALGRIIKKRTMPM